MSKGTKPFTPWALDWRRAMNLWKPARTIRWSAASPARNSRPASPRITAASSSSCAAKAVAGLPACTCRMLDSWFDVPRAVETTPAATETNTCLAQHRRHSNRIARTAAGHASDLAIYHRDIACHKAHDRAGQGCRDSERPSDRTKSPVKATVKAAARVTVTV